MIVIKVGGSLLGSPSLKMNLEKCIQQFKEPVALVVGGGELVNCLRSMHELHQLTEDESHWRALELMSVTANILSSITTFPIARSWDEIAEHLSGGQEVIVDVLSLAGIEDLEQSWNLTSDSLAAWVTQTLSATRLILAKSKPLDHSMTLDELALLDEVDSLFPNYARKIPVVEWCHLRAEEEQPEFQLTRIFSH